MKKVNLTFIIIILFINMINIKPKAIKVTEPIRAAVLLYKEDDYFISLLKNSLLELENQNKDVIKFIIYDGKDDEELQDKQLDDAINSQVDVILLNVVNEKKSCKLFEKIKKSNIPVVFFNREPLNISSIKEYTNKAVYVGTTACDSGNMQGDMIIKEWKNNSTLDKNADNAIQYILFQGDKDNLEAQHRSECVIRSIENKGIKTIKIAEEFCNWDRECAKKTMGKLFEDHGNEIEVIISNNDQMAIGVILALQEIGYNLGDPEKYIPVVGIDGIDEAVKLIQNGFMTGTVIQDYEAMAKALYRISVNLGEGKPALQNTEYKFDLTGIGVRIPYNGYLIKSSLR